MSSDVCAWGLFSRWLNFCRIMNYFSWHRCVIVFLQTKCQVWKSQSEWKSCRTKWFVVSETTWVAALRPLRPNLRRLWVAFWVSERSCVPREPRAFNEFSTWSWRTWYRPLRWLTGSWTRCPTRWPGWKLRKANVTSCSGLYFLHGRTHTHSEERFQSSGWCRADKRPIQCFSLNGTTNRERLFRKWTTN